jgi:hypothetical protein
LQLILQYLLTKRELASDTGQIALGGMDVHDQLMAGFQIGFLGQQGSAAAQAAIVFFLFKAKFS